MPNRTREVDRLVTHPSKEAAEAEAREVIDEYSHIDWDLKTTSIKGEWTWNLSSKHIDCWPYLHGYMALLRAGVFGDINTRTPQTSPVTAIDKVVDAAGNLGVNELERLANQSDRIEDQIQTVIWVGTGLRPKDF